MIDWQTPSPSAAGSSLRFYRIFYRTGRNGLVIHSTVQHDESRKCRSDGTRRTQQHQPAPLQREFKSPLAHRKTPAQQGSFCVWEARLLPEGVSRVDVGFVEPVLRDQVLLVESAGDNAAAHTNGIRERADVNGRLQRRHPW